MDRSLDSRSWHRGFAAGALALALSVGGHIATSRSDASATSCPISRGPELSQRVMARVTHGIAASVVHRVAFAVLDAVLHRTCS